MKTKMNLKHILLTLLFLLLFGFSFSFTNFVSNKEIMRVAKDMKFSSTAEYKTQYETKDGTFIGIISNGKFANGEFDFLSQEIYVGSFSDSHLKEGKMVFPGVGYYEGKFENNKRQGHGKFYFDNKDTYEGVWDKDCLSSGKYTFQSGDYFEGRFINNKPYYGDFIVKESDKEIKISIKDGTTRKYVKYDASNGDYLDGFFDGNVFSGSAHLTYTDGSIYEGEVIEGKRDGTGTYTWNTGEFYDGKWTDNKMNGYGTYYYKGKEKYPRLVGIFENGVPNGSFEYYIDSNTYFNTEWNSGKCIKVIEPQ